jgi:hypothetical protein
MPWFPGFRSTPAKVAASPSVGPSNRQSAASVRQLARAWSIMSGPVRQTLTAILQLDPAPHPSGEVGRGSEPESKGTLLSRQYVPVVAGSVVAYAVCQVAISLSPTETCHLDEPFSPYTYQVAIAVLSCYAMTCCYYVVSACLASTWSQEKEQQHVQAVFVASATISAIAGAATAVFLSPSGIYVCRDALGIDSIHAQWAEWLVEMPLLAYVMIAVEDKTQLSWVDTVSVVLYFVR